VHGRIYGAGRAESHQKKAARVIARLKAVLREETPKKGLQQETEFILHRSTYIAYAKVASEKPSASTKYVYTAMPKKQQLKCVHRVKHGQNPGKSIACKFRKFIF
jgi:hypothetical protein